MRLHVITVFCILHGTLRGCLAASLVETHARPMVPSKSGDNAPPSTNSVQPKDGVYSMLLTDSGKSDWSYPVVRVRIGVRQVPVNLAVSLHSNDTWLLSRSKGVCESEQSCPVLEPERLQTSNGIDTKWNYTGQNDLYVSGTLYNFSSFEPLADSKGQWRLEDFTMGVAWTENHADRLGEVDGVLGLGPGSTFLQKLTQSHKQAISMYLGKDNGTLVIGGYLPTQGIGKYTSTSMAGAGVLQLLIRSLTLKTNQTVLLKDIEAVIDPGWPYINIPQSVQTALNENGNSDAPEASVVFDLGDGVSVETEMGEDTFRVGDDNKLILGRPFLRSAYLVVDNTHTTYHIAQANIKNIDIGNPIAISVLSSLDSLTNPESTNTDGSKSNSDEPSTETSTDSEDPNTDSDGATDTDSGKNINLGIIIGGALGGLALIAIVIGVFLYFRRRSRRQVNEIKGYSGAPKRLSEASAFDAPTIAVPRSLSPPDFMQEDTHLMEGYPVVQQQHTPGSRSSIFREEINTSGPTPLPPSMQYQYEEDDRIGGFRGPSSRKPLRRDQDLVRTESVVSETDVDFPSMDRSGPSVPRLPMYHTRSEGAAL